MRKERGTAVTPNAECSVRAVSQPTNPAIGELFVNKETVLGASLVIATKATCSSSRADAILFRCGIDKRQGAHQVAQNSRTIGVLLGGDGLFEGYVSQTVPCNAGAVSPTESASEVLTSIRLARRWSKSATDTRHKCFRSVTFK